LPQAAESGNASPFARHAPAAEVLGAHAASARTQSLGVMAIVWGLALIGGAAVVITLIVGVGLFMARGSLLPSAEDVVTDAPKHVTDTGFAKDVPLRAKGRGARTGTRGAGDKPTVPAAAPGPVTVIVPKGVFFQSVEVSCPGGVRARGAFSADRGGGLRATVRRVPSDRDCSLTFRGSIPASTTVRGHQTLQCTFEPTVCRPQQ